MYFTETAEGVILNVRAQPRSSKPGIAGIDGSGDAVKVRVRSAPVDGKANKELAETLADAFGIAKSAVRFKSGETSKTKKILLAGVPAETVRAAIGNVKTALLAISAAAFFAAAPAVAQTPAAARPSPAEVLKTLPKSQTSSDGFVTVVATDVPGDEIGFRDPLVVFAGSIAQSVAKTLSMKPLPRGRESALYIYAMDGRTNDTRVVARVAKGRTGRTVTKIWLPSPGHSDIGLLRTEVARAYIRAAVHSMRELPAPKGARPPAEMPPWLVEGFLRQTDLLLSRRDLRAAVELWFGGRFPYFPELCSREDVPPPLAGYIAGWIREKRLAGDILAGLAAGEELDGARLCEMLTGERLPAGQDAKSDRRLARMMRKVVSPGSAAGLDLELFLSRLLLHPPFYDRMFAGGRIVCNLRDAIALSQTDRSIRAAAARKAREIPLYALGKGEALQNASLAYMDFCNALAAGESPGRLAMMLDEADAKFAQAAAEARKNEEEDAK